VSTEKIYYVDQAIIQRLNDEFSLIEDEGWYQLYQNKADSSFWRLDKYDKYQEQIFVQLESKENWSTFNDEELRIQLLLNTRGTADNICSWHGCENKALKNLIFCERHAYLEMGIRR